MVPSVLSPVSSTLLLIKKKRVCSKNQSVCVSYQKGGGGASPGSGQKES